MKITLGFTESDRANDYSSFDDGYRPGATQVIVDIEVGDGHALDTRAWADAAFEASNAPEFYRDSEPVKDIRDGLRRAQRDGARLRSLSKGDTVTVNNATYACDSVGWTRVEEWVGFRDGRIVAAYLTREDADRALRRRDIDAASPKPAPAVTP